MLEEREDLHPLPMIAFTIILILSATRLGMCCIPRGSLAQGTFNTGYREEGAEGYNTLRTLTNNRTTQNKTEHKSNVLKITRKF